MCGGDSDDDRDAKPEWKKSWSHGRNNWLPATIPKDRVSYWNGSSGDPSDASLARLDQLSGRSDSDSNDDERCQRGRASELRVVRSMD